MLDYKHPAIRLVLFLILAACIAMFFFYIKGYDTSLGWTLSTETDFEEVVAHEFQKGPFQFQLKGEKVTLSESFYGGEIDRLSTHSLVYFIAIILGISLSIASASYMKQFGFLVFSGLFLFFLITLQLDQYFGVDKWIAIIPFGALIGLGYGFQSFWTNSTFLIRVGAITLVTAVMVLLVPGGVASFSNQFFAQGTVPLMLVAFIFIALVSEELIFGLLYLLTRNKGGKGNLTHMLIMGGLYVANLAGYYLNRAGIFEVPFTFMNPFVLLALSTLVAIWSYKFKLGLLGNSMHYVPAFVLVLSFGLITFSFLGFGFARGLDGIAEGMHYLIIYAHLGFGFMFLAYIIINLIDPLVQGLQVYKVIYKPQTFHYTTARLAGLAAIAAFFFLSSQAPLNLFQSVRYSLKADMALEEGEQELAITYLKNADFYGFNSHYPNYNLGSIYLKRGNLQVAREHFRKASDRYPSAQSFLNTSNLQTSSDLSLATVHLDRGLQMFPDQPELLNNLGLINWKSGSLDKAYSYFKDTQSDQNWNQAPVVNKWGVLANKRDLMDANPALDYERGNLPAKANVLSALLSSGRAAEVSFDATLLKGASYPLQRQAFLLNSTFVFSDTSINSLIKKELETPIFGLQQQMSRAQALNQYLTGQVRSAFWSFDKALSTKSGGQAGVVLNDMGLLALDQGANLVARDFFDDAIESGYREAAFNKMVALLEAGEIGLAEQEVNNLIAVDTSYVPIKKSLINVFNPGTDTTLEARFNEIYFRFRDFSAADLITRLEPFDQGTRSIIFNRVGQEYENDLTQPDESLGIILPDYSDLDSMTVLNAAKEQPFNERLVLEASHLLESKDPVDAYNFMHEMLDFNKYSVSLLKEQAMLCIKIGLPEYASELKLRLGELMTASEYVAFEIEWYSLKQKLEADWSGQ